MSENDPRAERLRRLYRAHGEALLAYALRRAAGPEDAADLVSDVFLVAWRRIDEVPRGEEARLWLYGVARKTLSNQARGERRRTRLGEALREHVVAAAPARAEIDPELARALGTLRPIDRELLALAALAVPATAVAIEAAGIHTGIFPGQGDTELVPGEELLQLDSPDIVPYVREITRGIPLPDGASWEPFLARWPLSEPTLAQETAIGSEAEWFARCAWIERGDRKMVEESWTWRYSRGLEGLSGFPIEQVFKANCR